MDPGDKFRFHYVPQVSNSVPAPLYNFRRDSGDYQVRMGLHLPRLSDFHAFRSQS